MKEVKQNVTLGTQTLQNSAQEEHTYKEAYGIEHPMNNQPNGKLLERTPIENTPFWLIGNEENGYQIAYGKYALTSKYPTKEKTLNILKEQPYTVTAVMCGVIAQYTIENNQK